MGFGPPLLFRQIIRIFSFLVMLMACCRRKAQMHAFPDVPQPAWRNGIPGLVRPGRGQEAQAVELQLFVSCRCFRLLSVTSCFAIFCSLLDQVC